jgi:16S rRNA (cytosine1402-N4)-methyltransferase
MSTHIPVLLHEAIEYLDVRDGKTYLDLTLGRAGHASEILKRIPHGRLIGFDQDPEAVEASTKTLQQIGNNFTVIRDNFVNLEPHLKALGITSVDGILMDLGVSSPQLDEAARGFSYKEEAPLDMRMDPSNPLTAGIVVNTYPLPRLAGIIREYGEDKDAYLIAKKIVWAREKKPIGTTTELAELIKSAKPKAELEKKGHPAKQAFQAIRMEVNHEEETLKSTLLAAPMWLSAGGRLVVISFMSLDDRLVKQRFHELSVIEGSRQDFGLLPSQVQVPQFRNLTKKPITPSEDELNANHRSASAKLRALEKI